MMITNVNFEKEHLLNRLSCKSWAKAADTCKKRKYELVQKCYGSISTDQAYLWYYLWCGLERGSTLQGSYRG